MKKIIQNGNPLRADKYIYTTDCHHCGCVFEFEAEDVDWYNEQRDEVSTHCPYCNGQIIEPMSKVEKRFKIKENK